jgi:CRISPR system Cascade subunit CasE
MTHMTQLALDPARLMRFARGQGRGLERDPDFGYAAHAWLAAAFGDLAPKPFRLMENRNGLKLLGYADAGADALADQAHTYAEPETLNVCDWTAVQSKTMPDRWPTGRLLGFELRACPVSRGHRERDVYLAALERAQAENERPPSRLEAYGRWLVERLAAAIRPGDDYVDRSGQRRDPVVELDLEGLTLTGFRRVRTRRKAHRDRQSPYKTIERPDALFNGRLTVRDPERFGRLLAGGIGRHKAFGFGMLLLRPPR